jgi:hypothetical protein
MSKNHKPVEKVCGECLWSKDDLSSINGLAYVLCSKQIKYKCFQSFSCSDFGFSKQAKEKQDRYERQKLKQSEDERILAKGW